MKPRKKLAITWWMTICLSVLLSTTWIVATPNICTADEEDQSFTRNHPLDDDVEIYEYRLPELTPRARCVSACNDATQADWEHTPEMDKCVYCNCDSTRFQLGCNGARIIVY